MQRSRRTTFRPEGKSTDMTHVTVTFSGTHEFLCRSKLNSFDDHGMCHSRTVLLKQVQAMAPPPSNLTDTNMAACLFFGVVWKAVTRRPLFREKTEQQSR
jgi:hypothetical protein